MGFPSADASRAQRLSRLDRFASMTPTLVREVVTAGDLLRVRSGEVLIQQDERSAGAYVVISGELSVARNGQDVGVMCAGDLIGEIGVVVSPLRTSTVVALTECELIHLPEEIARGLYDEHPAFRNALWGTAQERLMRDLHSELVPHPSNPPD